MILDAPVQRANGLSLQMVVDRVIDPSVFLLFWIGRSC